MTKKIIIYVALLAVIVLAGVGLIYKPFQPSVVAVSMDDSEATPEGVKAVVEANNQFAFDFYVKHASDSNFFFSPYSISNAMYMVYEGAKGDTASQIANVFHLPETGILESASAKIYNEINKTDKSYALNTANALWTQKDYTFLQDYFQRIERYYGGKLTNLDFVNNAENSRLTINKWVEYETNNKIKDLIPEGAISELTRMVLTNAIYFKGDWQKQFTKADTKQADFNVAVGKTIKTDMMQLAGEDAKFKYAENNDAQILNLPYKGDELSMILILPKEGKTIKDAEKYLSLQGFSNLKTEMQESRVNVYIPKFKLETKYIMADDLSSMGMPVAFSTAADLSGMTGNRDLFISQVIHQAFVEVNEEGTEAAAATGIVVGTSSVNPVSIKTFRADHPFLFLIQQNSTGNILFLGRLNNPAQ